MTEEKLRAIIYKGNFQYDVVNDFAQHIGQVLERQGYEIIYIDLLKIESLKELIVYFEEKVDFVVGFNNIGINLSYKGKSIYDLFNTVYIAWLVDHPIYLQDAITMKFRNKVVVCVDDTHVDYIEKYMDASILTTFIPHAVDRVIFENNKIYDVVFSGHMHSTESYIQKVRELDTWIPNFSSMLEERRVKDGAVDLGVFMHEVYVKYPHVSEIIAKNSGLDTAIIQLIDQYIRTMNRNVAIQVLLDADIDVHFFGTIEEQHPFLAHPKFINHGKVSFTEMKTVFSQSKIILNILPNFPQGGHERIFTSLMCGALCVTDTNQYIEQHFAHLPTYRFSELELLPRLVKQLLENEEILRLKMEENRQLVLENHTWENRVAELLSVVDYCKNIFK